MAMEHHTEYSEKIIRLSSEMGISPEIYAKLRITFKTSVEDLIDKLDCALLTEDLSAVLRHSHSLKGVSLNMRYQTLADFAIEMEKQAREDNLESVRQTFEELKRSLPFELDETGSTTSTRLMTSQPASEAMTEKKEMILVVDDNQANIDLLREVLKNSGYMVESCISGEQALQFVSNSLPDLILLDVTMPGIDGFEVCRILKKDHKTAAIPVIFLTGRSETEAIINGFKVGGRDYITYPFNHAELLVRAETQITMKKQMQEIKRGRSEIEKRRKISEIKNALFTDFLKLSGNLEAASLVRNIEEIIAASSEYSCAQYIHINHVPDVPELKQDLFNFLKKADFKLSESDIEVLMDSLEQLVYNKAEDTHDIIGQNCFHMGIIRSNPDENSPVSVIIGLLIVLSQKDSEHLHIKKDIFRIVMKLTSILEELLISNERRMQLHEVEYELKAAERIHRNLLPQSIPDSEVFDIYGINKSFGSIGGDFFNAFKVQYHKIGCCIADVSGKGLPAALMATSIWTMFRDVLNDTVYDHKALFKIFDTLKNDNNTLNSAQQFDQKVMSSVRPLLLDELFRKLNNSATGTLNDYSFVTMMYLLLDEETRSASYVNAGHVPLLIYSSKNAKSEFIEMPSTPIGILADVEFPSRTVSLESGDILFLYTDGVVEAKKYHGNSYELFGESRLKEIFEGSVKLTSRELTENILTHVQEFSEGNLSDDLTIVTVKVK